MTEKWTTLVVPGYNVVRVVPSIRCVCSYDYFWTKWPLTYIFIVVCSTFPF